MLALVLAKVKIDEALFVRETGRVGWAVRKGNSQLQAAIKDFDANQARKLGIYEYRLKQSMQHVKQLQDPTATTDWKRFEQTLALFRRYGDRYGFDPLMLAAQG